MEKLKATHKPDPERCSKHTTESLVSPGDYFIAECPEGNYYIKYMCPCGCGKPDSIPIGNFFEGSWKWNGDRENITLTPSILRHQVCGWHGFLTNGYWETCADSPRKTK